MSQFEVTLSGGLLVSVRSGKISEKSSIFRTFPAGIVTEWYHAYRWVEKSFPAFTNPPDELLRQPLQKATASYEHSR